MSFVKELHAKMDAASGIVHVPADDEVRLETKCIQVAQRVRYNVWRWTYADGLQPISSNIKTDKQSILQWKGVVDPVGNVQSPGLLSTIREWTEGPSIVIAYDLFTMVNRLPTLPMAARLIKDITLAQQNPQPESTDEETAAAEIEAATCQLVVCDMQTLDIDVPLHRVELEMPDRSELILILDGIIETIEEDIAEAAKKDRDKILNALMGLAAYQAANAISESISRTGHINPDVIRDFKKEMIAGKGVTWVDPDPRGFDSLGGLDPIKAWMKRRAMVMLNEETRKQYGLSNPKALICAGIPGTGKSAGAKALASELGVPLLRVDFGNLRDKFQGGSEENLMIMLSCVESTSPVVMHVDEVEKALGESNNEVDGGTGNRMLGTFLTWMQENESQVFVYLTANRPDRLPPELLRAGRTSGQFWFDLPSKTERTAIIEVFRKKYPKSSDVDAKELTQASERCTGAEIETAFEEASVTAMIEDRDVTTEDVVIELEKISKVADTFEMTEALEKWKASAQTANSYENSEQTSTPISRRTRRVRRNARS